MRGPWAVGRRAWAAGGRAAGVRAPRDLPGYDGFPALQSCTCPDNSQSTRFLVSVHEPRGHGAAGVRNRGPLAPRAIGVRSLLGGQDSAGGHESGVCWGSGACWFARAAGEPRGCSASGVGGGSGPPGCRVAGGGVGVRRVREVLELQRIPGLEPRVWPRTTCRHGRSRTAGSTWLQRLLTTVGCAVLSAPPQSLGLDLAGPRCSPPARGNSGCASSCRSCARRRSGCLLVQ